MIVCFWTLTPWESEEPISPFKNTSKAQISWISPKATQASSLLMTKSFWIFTSAEGIPYWKRKLPMVTRSARDQVQVTPLNTLWRPAGNTARPRDSSKLRLFYSLLTPQLQVTAAIPNISKYHWEKDHPIQEIYLFSFSKTVFQRDATNPMNKCWIMDSVLSNFLWEMLPQVACHWRHFMGIAKYPVRRGWGRTKRWKRISFTSIQRTGS